MNYFFFHYSFVNDGIEVMGFSFSLFFNQNFSVQKYYFSTFHYYIVYCVTKVMGMNFNFNTNFSVSNYYFSIYYIKGINSTDCCSTKVVFIYSIIVVIVVIFIIIIIIIIIVIVIVIFVIIVIVIFVTIVIVIFFTIVIVIFVTIPVIRVIIIICWGLSVNSTLLRYYLFSVFLYCVYLYLNIKRLCTL